MNMISNQLICITLGITIIVAKADESKFIIHFIIQCRKFK